jgi:lipid-A-disaccharide synthase
MEAFDSRGPIMKIMFCAGEASGDMHGAGLARTILEIAPETELIGMGGSQMAAAGVRILYDIKNLGFIGIGEIIKKIPFFFRLRDFLLQQMKEEKPDILVCIDYPGFNMRLIKKAKALGIPVVYYILPTIWAWHKSRGPVIAQYTDLAIALFPFEEQLYRRIGTHVVYAGHPLLDVVHPDMDAAAARTYFGLDPAKRTILLMPGSRLQEVKGLLPDMLGAARRIAAVVPDVQFLLPRATTIDKELLDEYIKAGGVPVVVAQDHVYDMMNVSTAAIVASGTATLETAIMGLPTVLTYRVSALTYWLAKLLVHVTSIGLPNIIAGHRIMPELWQKDVTPERICAEILPILQDKAVEAARRQDMASVRQIMGESGAIRRISTTILEFAKEKSHS